MKNFICVRCGVEYPKSENPPAGCPICQDERENVAWDGQQWTTMDELLASGHRNDIREEEPGLTGIGIAPSFSIGQRALLVQTPQGNVLFDCVSLLDDHAVKTIQSLGGIQAICFSHPHFYDSMVSWSQAFDDAPIYIPEADREWVMNPSPSIEYWDGKPLELFPGVTLIMCGGHFSGSAVLHWQEGAGGKGVLLTGDTITVVQDRRYTSFMRSYPNLIPLGGDDIRRIVQAIEPYEFDRVYGGWWGKHILNNAKEAIRISAKRYLESIRD